MDKNKIQEAYGRYWKYVEGLVDEEGWTECRSVSHMLDYYYEQNENKKVEFQKAGSSPSGYSRWRPIELKEKQYII